MQTIKIDSVKKHSISKDLYMQFMEPLGITDGSVEAAWDFEKNDWRTDVTEIVKELSPSLIRFGGVFSAYYKWKDGVGPFAKRKPVYNVEWGGIESGAVGTDEFVRFCRNVGASPFMPVGLISKLFARNMGEYAINVSGGGELDVTASCTTTGDIYLHVVNTSCDKSVKARFEIDGKSVTNGKVTYLCADPLFEVTEFTCKDLSEKEENFDNGEYVFLPASVSAVILQKA